MTLFQVKFLREEFLRYSYILSFLIFMAPFIYLRDILRFIKEVAQLNVHATIDIGPVRLIGESLKTVMENL